MTLMGQCLPPRRPTLLTNLVLKMNVYTLWPVLMDATLTTLLSRHTVAMRPNDFFEKWA